MSDDPYQPYADTFNELKTTYSSMVQWHSTIQTHGEAWLQQTVDRGVPLSGYDPSMIDALIQRSKAVSTKSRKAYLQLIQLDSTLGMGDNFAARVTTWPWPEHAQDEPFAEPPVPDVRPWAQVPENERRLWTKFRNYDPATGRWFNEDGPSEAVYEELLRDNRIRETTRRAQQEWAERRRDHYTTEPGTKPLDAFKMIKDMASMLKSASDALVEKARARALAYAERTG